MQSSDCSDSGALVDCVKMKDLVIRAGAARVEMYETSSA